MVILKDLDRINLLGGSSNLAVVDSLGKPQRIESLVKVVFTRTQVDEHQRFGVASKRVH